MGWFTNDKPAKNAILAQAQVLGVQTGGTQRQFGGGVPEQKTDFALEVRVEGWPPYQANASRFVPLTQLPQFAMGLTFVAVWVDPEHPEKVVLDLTIPPPVVTTAPGAGQPSAARLLAEGRPGDAVIQQFSALPMRNPEGHQMFAFSLTVIPPDAPPYMIQVGNPAPPEAYPMLFPGSRVPVRIGAGPYEVAIDWHRALGPPGVDLAKP